MSLIMTITTVALTQQQNYQQNTSIRQKVTLLSPVKLKQNDRSADIPHQTTTMNHFSNLSSSVESLAKNEIEEVTYEKPKEIKLQLMLLVLERYLGRPLDISDYNIIKNNEKSSHTNEPVDETLAATNELLINIEGQLFQQGDILSVEEWRDHEQHLSYQVQGKFTLNEQALSLDYNLFISNKRTSYSAVEMSAAALKDPLIVQFGSQGLGNIKGQKDFHINQDNVIDELPIFAGDIGYLVYDKNNNQRADNGSELFGPTTGQGFNELTKLDSNNNGFIDAEDQQFAQLYIWQPNAKKNQTEQWLSLSDANIQAMSLSAVQTPFDFYDQQGEIQAQLRLSSFAITKEGYGRGVHQIDVRI